jgi:alpha-ribazole phosphatase
MKKQITVIRHGLTEGNLKKWYYGASDIPLDPQGVAALKTLAAEKIYPDPSGADFYVSGMLRTRQSLKAIYGDVPYSVIPDLRELNFGIFEKCTYDELRNDPQYREWLADPTGRIMPQGESMGGFSARVMRGWRELTSQCDDKAIAVIHGGPISCIMRNLFEPQAQYFKWVPDPGHGYTITVDSGAEPEYAEL